MRSPAPYHALISCLLILSGLFNGNIFARTISDTLQDDSIRVEALLIKDTIDLKIDGTTSEATFFMNGMVFLSNTKYHQKMIPDHITFGMIKAYFVPLEYMAMKNSRPLFSNDDFPYSPAGMSFSRDYKHVYFTKPVDVQGRKNVEKIYEMAIIKGKASSPNQISFTGDSYRYMHPAISMDESFMVFASDHPPSRGGLDLFLSEKTESGWSIPVNMGSEVNSSGHEWYPYLDQQNNLYFSSSGHPGYGGYDIFVCYFNGTSWNAPQNLTDYINSTRDEIGFSIHPNKQIALLSQVPEGKKKGDILTISFNNKAFMLTGMDEAGNRDITVLFKDLVETGYTKGSFPEFDESMANAGRPYISTPLIVEKKAADDPRPEPAAPLPGQATGKSKPVSQPEVTVTGTEVTASKAGPDPNSVIFRVQLLSSTVPNKYPSVTVSGKKYPTFEYYYKGAYRTTVGVFETVQEANAFRLKCKSSGYKQAFVAAFRGNNRETDPSVFKK